LQFISIHVRHNDFKDWCEPDVSLDGCFAPLSAIQRRVREVQDEIKECKGIEVQHVIVTSDEKNHTWWRDVDELGWLVVDHTRTKELYGLWYVFLLPSWAAADWSLPGILSSSTLSYNPRVLDSWAPPEARSRSLPVEGFNHGKTVLPEW
jgi:hypothetical protein